MPKKHHTDYTKQAQAVHNSSPKSQDGAGTGSSSSASVNQRLEQLRREQAPKATAEQRHAVSAVVSNPTLPPTVRHLLAIPETAPPKPKRGQTFRQRRDPPSNGAAYVGRAPAGPAAPLSWLHSSRHAPRNTRGVDGDGKVLQSSSSGGVRRARGRYNLSTMDKTLPDLPRPGSLMDTVLKNFARNWDWLVEYEQLNLATLSMSLKTMLLSYIALYGPDEGFSISSLRTLFLNDAELDGGTGSKELEVLDLSGLVGYPHSITLPELQRYWTSPVAKHSSTDLASAMQATALDEPIESWEDANASDSSSSSIPKAIINRFPRLTVLSLSNPSPTISWAHLLNLSQHLSTLTHLSLAHWPTPSLTPNARTAVVESRHGNVSLGATNLYSAMDDDWHEAANILRRFSNNTYRLRYLDLEGCNDWLPALIYTERDEPSDQWATDRVRGASSSASTARDDNTDASTIGSTEGPGWNTSWAQLTHVNISQGWIPTDTAAVRALPSGSLQIQLLNYLRTRSNTTSSATRRRDRAMSLLGRAVHSDELQTYQVKRWLEREKEARRVVGTIRALRSSAGGRWIGFEHGWDANASGVGVSSGDVDVAVEASRRAMSAAMAG